MSENPPGADALRVVVCIKQVLDPEAPPSLLGVDPATHEVTGRGVAPRLDPYSMHALQAALSLRTAASHVGREVVIHVVGVGPSPSRNLYLRALAAGADRVTLVDTSSEPILFGDAWATAQRLAGVLATAAPEGVDLVLVGRRAADTNAGAVGPALARSLGWPVVCLAAGISLDPAAGASSGILVDQLADAGPITVACGLPAVVSVSHEVGEVPVVPFAKMVEAKRMPLRIITPGDLVAIPSDLADIGPAGLPAPAVVGMRAHDERRTCELLTAEDDRAAGRALALRLSDGRSKPTAHEGCRVPLSGR